MTAKLTSRMLVSALVRRVQAEGGNAAVVAKGDENAGAVVLILSDKGEIGALKERVLDLDGRYIWVDCGPKNIEDKEEISAYLERRRSRDPDLWLVELDIAGAERFAAETIQSH